MQTTETTSPSQQSFSEGENSNVIQRQTAKLPSDAFLYAAAGSIAASLTLKMMGRRDDALFVGQWAPTFLALGLYSKLVKLFGTTTRQP